MQVSKSNIIPIHSNEVKIASQFCRFLRLRIMPSKLAFVTGATGFIGSQVVASALQDGYTVRVSVRKPEQMDTLKGIFHDDVSRLQFVVVPDISVPGAFDSALDGVQVVFHLASPMPGQGSDLHRDYLEPARNGTLSMLESASKVGSIKRVIVMSSILGIGPVDLFYNTDTFVAGEFLGYIVHA